MVRSRVRFTHWWRLSISNLTCSHASVSGGARRWAAVACCLPWGLSGSLCASFSIVCHLWSTGGKKTHNTHSLNEGWGWYTLGSHRDCEKKTLLLLRHAHKSHEDTDRCSTVPHWQTHTHTHTHQKNYTHSHRHTRMYVKYWIYTLMLIDINLA